VSSAVRQSESQAPVVPASAKQGAEAQGQRWTWVEVSVWNERMLAALKKNGVNGGTWPKAFFADMGLFTMTEAYALASHSR